MTQSGGDQNVYPYNQDLFRNKIKKVKLSEGEKLFISYNPDDYSDYTIGYITINQIINCERSYELFDKMKDLADFMTLNGIDITENYPTRKDFEEAYPGIKQKYVDELYNTDGTKKDK